MKDHIRQAQSVTHSATHASVADITDALLTMGLSNPFEALECVILDRALLHANGDIAAAALLGISGGEPKVLTIKHGLGKCLQ